MAPQLHNKTMQMIKLWKLKSKLAHGRAFWMADDITNMMLDAIMASTFSLDESADVLLAHMQHLSSHGPIASPTTTTAQLSSRQARCLPSQIL